MERMVETNCPVPSKPLPLLTCPLRVNFMSSMLVRALARQRHYLRSSEAAIVLLAVAIGLAAGLFMLIQSGAAHMMQRLFYGTDVERLSALKTIDPYRLIILPTGGLLLFMLSFATRTRKRVPIDVVEANALHGGLIPMKDNLLVSAQTLISNGVGASVGLEAAYAQMGGGFASTVGQMFKLRRNDLRILVGAGAGAAVGAAFNAPLTGAFYAFEIVIGAYTPAAIAPVAAACLAAAILVRSAGYPSYEIALPGTHAITTPDYLLYAALGFVCAVVGIMLMQTVTWIELGLRRSPIPDRLRPIIGGSLLIPLAWLSPQAMSGGHGALHQDLAIPLSLGFLATIFLIKIAASAISLGFGFRGGLFFASLFLGSLVGQAYALLIGHFPALPPIDPVDSALVGMAAMAVAVIGGPMTMSLLVLESTHDFALTGTAITAALCASTFVRETFGFSFSTWRLHTRGETIRSARDVGWVKSLTAGRMMRRSPQTVAASTSIAEFRRRFPLGSVDLVVLTKDHEIYAGLLPTALAHTLDLDTTAPVGPIARLPERALSPEQDVATVMRMFDENEADDLAVVDETGKILGTVSEKYVRRRYAEEIEKTHRELFGED